MCFDVSTVFNLNQYFGECVCEGNICPFPTMAELDSSLSWERKNDLKCLVAGGCTFAGGITATFGGWTWLITGAAMGAIGNLASYRYTRTTQEQIDHDANVKMLVDERAAILARISQLEEASKDANESKLRCEKEMKERIAALEKALAEHQELLKAEPHSSGKKD